MWFRSMCKSLARSSRRRQKLALDGKQRARQLLLEGLEDRSLMAFNFLSEYATGASPASVVLADVNADSRPDMIVANSGSASMDVRLGNSDGTFGPAISSSQAGAASSVAVGDFDRDGAVDLVTTGSSLSVLRGNGDGSFQPPVALPIPPQPIPGFPIIQPQVLSSVAVGDLNEDGKLDLVVAGSTFFMNCPWYCYGTYGDEYVNVLLGNGSGGFGEPEVLPLHSGPHYHSGAVAVEDLNHDGHSDVIATRRTGGLSVFLGDGTGAVGNPINSGSGSPLSSLSLGDIDGDGILDTVLRGGAGLIVQKGHGDGTFVPSTSVNVGQYADAAVVGDVNADGKLDLVTVSSEHTCTNAYYSCYEGYTTKKINVVLGTGQGGFAAPSATTLGTIDGFYDAAQYSSLTLADLTGDGLPDLAASDSSASQVIVAKGNWPPSGAPFINVSNASVLEGDSGSSAVSVTVSLSAPSTQTVTADFHTADGSALAGSDYQSISGSLTFAPGQASQTITLLVYGDRLSEADESFAVLLDNVVNANVGSQGTVKIIENEPRLSINHVLGIDPLTVVEGDVGTKPAVFTVTLAAPYDQEVTVHYYTLTGHIADIVSADGTLRFAPGQTSQTITVQVVGDLLHEELEAFNVYLDNPSPNATIVNFAGYCFIEDNDPAAPPTIGITDASVAEGNSGTKLMQFTVFLSRVSGQEVRVNYATANSSATTSDNDYVAKSGTLVFAPGQTSKTITVSIKGDTKKESDEKFYVNLSSAIGGTIADSQGVGTILNDDSGGNPKGNRISSTSAIDAAMDELMFSGRKKRGR